MSQATEATAEGQAAPANDRKKSGGLNSMLLPELKRLASSLGIKGAGAMRKSALVDAIAAAQSGGAAGSPRASAETATAAPAGSSSGAATEERRGSEGADRRDRSDDGSGRQRGDSDQDARREERSSDHGQPRRDGGDQNRGEQNRGEQNRVEQNRGDQQGDQQRGDQRRHDEQRRDDRGRNQGDDRDRDQGQQRQDGSGKGRDQGSQRRDDDRGGGSRSSRRRRNRDRYRDRDRDRRRDDAEPQVSEDDVLVPAAGILDILDNYAFVRTSGYLPGPDDVYVSMSMVRKYGLRKGDAITGAVKQVQEGQRREKYNPIVRIDTVNGGDVEAARHRVDFNKLTPLYPSDRLRLETEAGNLIGRVIDIAAPIGKGQRGLIVSPSKAGKTMIMQSIANSITTNNPECHLMVVLVDERPEEVTDFERSVKGEVISSTFDRPASDHTLVSELAIERAKRLVELGHDVVVLLDGITRLGRAYNLAAPASGRILSGGVDSAALYPPKKFFGAARNIENGGSLTILATALIESGSKMDEVIFEEFKGTGNMEIRLRRDFADKRLFPAIDAVQSGTRREELLMSRDELQIVWKLRRVLSALDGQQALELLLQKLKQTKSNVEFLMEVNKTTPTASGLRGDDS